MKKLITLLILFVGMISTVSAATETTVYYAVPSSVVGTYTVKLKVNRQGDNDNPATYTMTKTTKTYDGKLIYSCEYTDLWDGVGYMLFQLYNGDTWVSEDCSVGYPEGGGIHWVWTAASTYNGKLHVHGGGNSNSGTPWVTYNTDGIKGSWDNWQTKKEFVNGQLTIDINSGNYHEFKIEVGGALYGPQNSGATMFWNNCTNWTLSSTSNNCYLQTSAFGTYTFTLAESKNVSVTFPSYTPNEIYLYNNLGLSAAPYAYILQGDNWGDKGSGSNNQPKGVTMTQVGESNVWKAEYPAGAHHNYIAFTQDLMDGYNNFNSGKAVYRGDLPTTSSVFVPNTSTSDSKNGTTYYNNGEWHAYPTFTRTVTEGNFGTICLPFDATVTGATIYEITSAVKNGSGNLTAINLTETSSNLTGGKAYIFKATASNLVATYSGEYKEATLISHMKGNLSSAKLTVPQGMYVVGGNQIHKVTGDGVTVGQYRGYLDLSDLEATSARGLNFISLEGETTGIDAVKQEVKANEVFFNLAGQRVAQPTKGLYIVNGKKVIIK